MRENSNKKGKINAKRAKLKAENGAQGVNLGISQESGKQFGFWGRGGGFGYGFQATS
jgi:hypothetical protein